MKNISDKFDQIKGLLIQNKDDEFIAKNINKISFLISLLPIPGLQQASMIAKEISGDVVLKNQFNQLKESINLNEGKIDKNTDSIEYLKLEVESLKQVESFRSKVEILLNKLSKEQTEYLVKTTDWSAQEIINTIIEYDTVTFLSDNNSYNKLFGVKVTSKKTILEATNRSTNVIKDAEFKGEKGRVGMENIDQKGLTEISESSVSFAKNSNVGMGGFEMGVDDKGNFVMGTRKQLSATCPNCQNEMQIGYVKPPLGSLLTCTNCGFSGRT
ncbi:MAG: hypothetical protein GY834_09000 [Bacteroidetes bacterium]|nr:hypothetical protein [Bacteroidota bacterium]